MSLFAHILLMFNSIHTYSCKLQETKALSNLAFIKYTITVLTTVTLIAAFVFTRCNSPSEITDRAENADRIMEYNRVINEIKKKIVWSYVDNIKEKLEIRLDELENF